MANVLCTWELGGGLGHLMCLKQFVDVAIRNGHKVFLMSVNAKLAHTVFGDTPITLIQAPSCSAKISFDPREYLSYTDIIRKQAFTNENELFRNVSIYKQAFDIVKPYLVIFDSCPTGLIASRDMPFMKVISSTGFGTPPLPTRKTEPFGVFPTTNVSSSNRKLLLENDEKLIRTINSVLIRTRNTPISTLYDICGSVDDTLVFSYPQIYHYDGKLDCVYLGDTIDNVNNPPELIWPESHGPKVFAYIEAIESLEYLLRDIEKSGLCAIVKLKDATDEYINAHTNKSITFIRGLIDYNVLPDVVDFVITNGNCGTACSMLRLGIPQLVIPTYQEQLYVSMKLEKHKCAVRATRNQKGYINEINELLHNHIYNESVKVIQKDVSVYNKGHALEYINDMF